MLGFRVHLSFFPGGGALAGPFGGRGFALWLRSDIFGFRVQGLGFGV